MADYSADYSLETLSTEKRGLRISTLRVNRSLFHTERMVIMTIPRGYLINCDMCVNRSQTSAEVTRTLVSMNEASVKVTFSAGDDVVLRYPAVINNGHWHYVTLNLEDEKVTLFVDATSVNSPKGFKTVDPF